MTKLVSLALTVGLIVLAVVGVGQCNGPAGSLVWKIGLEDNSAAEFTGASFPQALEVPDDWEQRRVWPELPGVSTGSVNTTPQAGDLLDTALNYELSDGAPHGLTFRLKTVNASSFVTEIAVFSNEWPCGILQIVGTEGWYPDSESRQFGNTYSLYIPPEALRVGQNSLRLEKLGHPYNRSNYSYLSFTLDWLELARLDSPPSEPVHSRYVHIGVQLGDFTINEGNCQTEPLAWQWLGMAYSGNPVRFAYWDNTMHLVTTPRQYLETVRDYNMQVVLNYTHGLTTKRSGKPEFATAEGTLAPYWQERMQDILDEYGDLVQYYEVTNEPCMAISDVPMTACVAIAEFVAAHKPAHMKLAAPAWTYGGGFGDPVDWDISAENRWRVEQYCDVTNGHAYANSYVTLRGSLLSTIDTFGKEGVIEKGFPREMINTEMGVHRTAHRDFDNLGVTAQSNASILDRCHRAHLGFCDTFMQFALFPLGDVEFAIVQGDKYSPATWIATDFPEVDSQRQDSVVKVLRRMVLAYATHGRPLSYKWVVPEEVTGRLVLFRAVDTSGLAPLPGSGSKSDVVLLNFVNFSRDPQRLRVKAQMPEACAWGGLRFGPDDQYLAARSEIRLLASPWVELDELLGPGESVQYQLRRLAQGSDVPAPPVKPEGLHAEAGRIGKLGYVKLRWQPSMGAASYKLQRSEDGARFLQLDEIPAGEGYYEDASRLGPDPGRHYWYRIKATNNGGESAPSQAISVQIPD